MRDQPEPTGKANLALDAEQPRDAGSGAIGSDDPVRHDRSLVARGRVADPGAADAPTFGRLLHRFNVEFGESTPDADLIAERAARRLKRVSLELGGKNAVVVLRDADLDLATDGILWSAFGTTGQRCTACSRVIVEKAVVEPLLERLEGERRKAEPGRAVLGLHLEQVALVAALQRRTGGSMAEVLERQTARIRSFLLETSILSRLTASLCAAVTGRRPVTRWRRRQLRPVRRKRR